MFFRWTPAFNVTSTVRVIQALFIDPDPNFPMNKEANNLLKTNFREYKKHVTACVEQSLEDDLDT